MNKVTLLMAVAISTASVLAMILAPITMTTNLANAYSCSSSSSGGTGLAHTSSHVHGSTGSCGTSSASVGPNSPSGGNANCLVGTPNCDAQPSPLAFSTSGGGSQSSCSASSSAANPEGSNINTISGSGKGSIVCTNHSP